jgi:hypothetical protein
MAQVEEGFVYLLILIDSEVVLEEEVVLVKCLHFHDSVLIAIGKESS